MKPVDQLIEATPENNGDCLRACLASILEMPALHVPLLGGYLKGERNQLLDLGAWLRRFGYTYVYAKADTTYLALALDHVEGLVEVSVYYIGCGPTVRGTKHAVVLQGPAAEIVHDPHPSRAGLLEVTDLLFLVPIDPAKSC
jgi:hypothetical protein